jgi:hypothetical protein
MAYVRLLTEYSRHGPAMLHNIFSSRQDRQHVDHMQQLPISSAYCTATSTSPAWCTSTIICSCESVSNTEIPLLNLKIVYSIHSFWMLNKCPALLNVRTCFAQTNMISNSHYTLTHDMPMQKLGSSRNTGRRAEAADTRSGRRVVQQHHVAHGAGAESAIWVDVHVSAASLNSCAGVSSRPFDRVGMHAARLITGGCLASLNYRRLNYRRLPDPATVRVVSPRARAYSRVQL